jgi:hypothetical protein
MAILRAPPWLTGVVLGEKEKNGSINQDMISCGRDVGVCENRPSWEGGTGPTNSSKKKKCVESQLGSSFTVSTVLGRVTTFY